METVTVLLDTNVLVRFLTLDNAKKYKNLYEFFESLESGAMRLELKLIVLLQTIFVLKSVYHVPRKQIASSIMDLLKYKGIVVKEKKSFYGHWRCGAKKTLKS
ncbi:MAG: hypothetical protein ACKVE4_04330 [Dissulfuribacterales bacterium]